MARATYYDGNRDLILGSSSRLRLFVYACMYVYACM